MKKFLACTLLLIPALVWSAPNQPSGKAAAPKASAKAASKSSKSAAKSTPKKTTVAKAAPKASSRAAVAAGTAGAAAAAVAAVSQAGPELAPEQMAIAELVHTGQMACELGASVQVTPDSSAPGHFHVKGKGFAYHMVPVASQTGAVRLEDSQRGAVWLQIANKSMLMNQKLGQRLADECMSPQQLQVAEAIKKNPLPNLLDGVAGK